MSAVWESARESAKKAAPVKPSSLKRIRDALAEADTEIEDLTKKLAAEKARADKAVSDLAAEREAHKRTRSGHAEALKRATDMIASEKERKEQEIRSAREERAAAQAEAKRHRDFIASGSQIAPLVSDIRSAIAALSAEVSALKASSIKPPRAASEAARKRSPRSYKFIFERGRDGRIVGAKATQSED